MLLTFLTKFSQPKSLLVRSPIRLFFELASELMFVRTIDIHHPQPAALIVVVHVYKLRPVGRPLRTESELQWALRRERTVVNEIHRIAAIGVRDENVR